MNNPDAPISQSTEDKFERKLFAYNLADSILNRSSSSPMTIGLYGVWGYGKTSLLRIVKERLTMDDENVILVEYNPWMFKDADSLTLGFLASLKQAISNDINKDKTRYKKLFKKWGVRISNFTKDYGGVTQAFSVLGVTIDASKLFGNSKSQNIILQKDKVNELIKASNKQVVIITDDIDRLNKEELKQLFKLVRMNADFENTTYLLSFDKEVVANAISEDYGDSNIKVGNEFLDKIIQVPLIIPSIQEFQLSAFFLEQLTATIKDSGVVFTEEEYRNFDRLATEILLPLVETPRDVVRVSNAIGFSIRLMPEELNVLDLCLLEALKVQQFEVYSWIWSNANLLTEPLFISGENSPEKEFRDNINSAIESLLAKISEPDCIIVCNALYSLFPWVEKPHRNLPFLHGEVNEYVKPRGIVNRDYIMRYFSFAIGEKQISEVELSHMLSALEAFNMAELKVELDKLIAKSSLSEVIDRLEEREIKSNELERIIYAFIKRDNSEGLAQHGPIMLGRSRLAAFISNSMRKLQSLGVDVFSIAVRMMNEANPFGYAYALNNELRAKYESGNQLFTKEEYDRLGDVLLKRAQGSLDSNAIFEKHDGNELGFLFRNWYRVDPEGLLKHVTSFIKDNPKRVGDLILAFAPIAIGGRSPEPYKSDFSQESYIHLTSYVDGRIIVKAILAAKYDSNLDNVKWDGWENVQTKENAILQFLHWHAKKYDADLLLGYEES
ncbi:KAP family P-loop NTPase fold protein [Phaeocystidibacter marisrubri]|uniref:KAP NTPase domain-containing protein n=1 Tax=Phaeocystidibacter marisrubri TaxID=1577780 RepID=A0A6L3ZC33_9FLAO|nr:P-loop NTPase fold protein [Phaeocystidibacter marisrubri]KAB2815186.1 hypothetical protein F8C82_13900 [Phaeocystidibacter marisrubri]GGH70771.1 hypothetical protein GCM10011318_13120 [Phaeocystidibacter marisrubri]